MGVSVEVTDYNAFWECDDCHKRAQTTGDKWDGLDIDEVPLPDGWRTKPNEMYRCDECGRAEDVLAYCPECSAKRDEDHAKRMELYKALKADGKDYGMFYMDGLRSTAPAQSFTVTSFTQTEVSGSGFNPYPRLPEPEW